MGLGRGEKRRSGPDIVSVKIGHRRRDGVEFGEGQDGIVLALSQEGYVLESVLETAPGEAWRVWGSVQTRFVDVLHRAVIALYHSFTASLAETVR
jgi:hypothetical protein